MSPVLFCWVPFWVPISRTFIQQNLVALPGSRVASDKRRYSIARGVNPLLRLIDISNIEPGAARDMNFSISGQRHNSIEAH